MELRLFIPCAALFSTYMNDQRSLARRSAPAVIPFRIYQCELKCRRSPQKGIATERFAKAYVDKQCPGNV